MEATLMQMDNGTGRATRSLPELPALSGFTDPIVSGWVNYATWLSDDILLMVGWFHAKEKRVQKVSLRVDDHTVPLDARCVSYPRPDLKDAGHNVGKVLTARFLGSANAREPLGNLVVETETTTFALGPLDLSHALTDLQILVRSGLAWLDPESRAEVLEFLVSTSKEHSGTTSGLRLSKNLFLLREALRERLPRSVIAQDQPQGLAVDSILSVDETSFYVRGWMRDEEAEVTQLTAVSPEGARVELLGRAFRYPRPDVEQFYDVTSSDLVLAKSGFISYFELEAPSRLRTEWTFEMRNTAGQTVEATAPRVVRDPHTVRNEILQDIIHESPSAEALIPNHVYPSIKRQQSLFREMVEVDDILEYGKPGKTPVVSVIVPLYQRIDFLEQQLAQFVHDPEIFEAELIYILDSPELADNLRSVAAQLFALYRLPFRVVMLKRNAGFSTVNNVGARLARGRLLLLLNSDVLPDKPGWLGKMIEFYDSMPGIGALAPKLLFEDDTLQHAGLYFYRQDDGLWGNEHFFKGLHRQLPVANTPRHVPAVTGACMMIDGELYKRFGGLRGIYVQGDYEDSDLCLRLIEAGYESWYLPDVELYHLEGQSYALASRQLNRRYNAWLHTHLWKERIEAVMAEYMPPGSHERTAPSSKRQRTRQPSAAGSPEREQDTAVKEQATRPNNKRGKRGASVRKRDG
jgi:GT2 family glycosyltransferase